MFHSFLTQTCAQIMCLFYKHYVACNSFVPEVETSATDILLWTENWHALLPSEAQFFWQTAPAYFNKSSFLKMALCSLLFYFLLKKPFFNTLDHVFFTS